MSTPKKRGLGRGLDALLGPKGAVTPVSVAAVAEPQPGEVLRRLPIDQLQPAKNGTVPEIFRAVNRDSMGAARKTLAWFQTGGALEVWAAEARRLAVQKGVSVHDYKFAFAAIEDAQSVSPAWIGQYLAASTFLLQGADKADNPLIQKVVGVLPDSKR